jgi:hypothetical protein
MTNVLGQYDYRAREAIARIQNEKSILTLEYRFSLTGDKAASSANLDLLTICNFPGEKGLEALLRCVALSEGQSKKTEIGTPAWNPADGVHQLLTRPEDPVYREKWKPVLEAYSAKTSALPQKQRHFIQRVNETLARDSKP